MLSSGAGSFRLFALHDSCIDIASHTHRWFPVKFDFSTGKKFVDLFQSEVASLWVEEVDKRQKAKVKDWIWVSKKFLSWWQRLDLLAK